MPHELVTVTHVVAISLPSVVLSFAMRLADCLDATPSPRTHVCTCHPTPNTSRPVSNPPAPSSLPSPISTPPPPRNTHPAPAKSFLSTQTKDLSHLYLHRRQHNPSTHPTPHSRDGELAFAGGGRKAQVRLGPRIRRTCLPGARGASTVPCAFSLLLLPGSPGCTVHTAPSRRRQLSGIRYRGRGSLQVSAVSVLEEDCGETVYI